MALPPASSADAPALRPVPAGCAAGRDPARTQCILTAQPGHRHRVHCALDRR